MTIYAVEYSDGEGSTVEGLYSTRELAEASWEIRNQPSYGSYEIFEFELDLDPKADEPDIDRSPRFGPKTQQDQIMSDMYSRMVLENLMAPTAFTYKPLPMRTGNTIEFFSYNISKSTTESI